MKKRDLWQIMSPESRRFVRLDWRSPGFAAGEKPRPATKLVIFEDDPIKADMWGRNGVEARLADERYPMQRDRLVIVPAPQCGCCGHTECTWTDPAERQLRMVAGNWHPNSQVWRCEKHVGRNPCCIDGCGKTFAHRKDEGYYGTVICTVHWRQAPKYMRDAVARIRKLAKRRGWTESLCQRHDRLWNRTYRAIVESSRLDSTEINKMFGWSDE